MVATTVTAYAPSGSAITEQPVDAVVQVFPPGDTVAV